MENIPEQHKEELRNRDLEDTPMLGEVEVEEDNRVDEE